MAHAPGALAAPKPDLSVTGLRFVPDPGASGAPSHIVLDSSGHGSFSVLVTTGNAVGRGPAPASETKLSLVSRGTSYPLAPQSVDALAGGETHRERVTQQASLPLGFATLKACADGQGAVPEANEANNCRSVGPIAIIPATWQVPRFVVDSTSFTGLVQKTWTSPGNFLYDYAGLGGSGQGRYFLYEATGVLRGQTTGNYGSCPASGQDSVIHGPWDSQTFLKLFTDLKHYTANVIASETYTFTVSCPGPPPYQVQTPYEPLNASDNRAGHLAAPGAKLIRGSYESNNSGNVLDYAWTFQADVP